MYFSNPDAVSFFSPTHPLLIEIKLTGTLQCGNEATFEVIHENVSAQIASAALRVDAATTPWTCHSSTV